LRRLLGALIEEMYYLRRRGRVVLVQPLIAALPYGTMVRLRTSLYRLAGVRIGTGSAIVGPLRIWGPAQLTIGANSTINGPCAICLDGPVTLHDGVLIGHDVIISTGSHEIGPSHARGGHVVPRPVVIGAGAWVGAGAMILPGVTVGAGSVVAAGAVVVHDVSPNTIAAGVPARTVRHLNDSGEHLTKDGEQDIEVP
jgi:maltose O-acetyltransferase